MKKIAIIVAMSNNQVIGVDNSLPWHISEDLKRFKQLTTGYPIIMGRKTYESIGKPLPNRVNYVVSTTIDQIEGAFVFKSTQDAIDDAINYCEKENKKEIVIIGGGFLFKDTLPVTNKLVLTKVDCDIAGDVFYPDIDFSEWEELSSERFSKDSNNDYDFIVSTYERVT